MIWIVSKRSHHCPSSLWSSLNPKNAMGRSNVPATPLGRVGRWSRVEIPRISRHVICTNGCNMRNSSLETEACIISVSFLYHFCIISVSFLHHFCIISASCIRFIMYLICIRCIWYYLILLSDNPQKEKVLIHRSSHTPFQRHLVGGSNDWDMTYSINTVSIPAHVMYFTEVNTVNC